jgi:hypothetical protein
MRRRKDDVNALLNGVLDRVAPSILAMLAAAKKPSELEGPHRNATEILYANAELESQ